MGINQVCALNPTFQYLDKESQESTQKLHESKKENTKNKLKTVIFDGSRLRGGQYLSPDKGVAQQHFIKEINALIDRSYDNYRYKASDKTNHIFVGIFDKDTKNILGLIMLLKKNCRGAQYCEVGVSIVDERYRGLGIQSLSTRELTSYAFNLFEQGYPLYATARTFAANTQFLLRNRTYPNKSGKPVQMGLPRGFAPYYVFEKDAWGRFFLEFHMQYDSWNTLDEVVSKFVYLPPVAMEKSFHIFNPKYRPDVQPQYAYPIIRGSGEIGLNYISGEPIIFPEIDYTRPEWATLAKMTSIIGHEEDEQHIKKSSSQKFDYSDSESPKPNLRIIQIEGINSYDFTRDFDDTMKSINVTVQVADFPDDTVKAANIALLNVLIKEGFVPASLHDILYRGKRIRIALMSRWRGIRVQSKFEILQDNKKTLDIFKHDCNVQGISWPMIVNIIQPERLRDKERHDGMCPIILNQHLPTLTQAIEMVEKPTQKNYLDCSLVNTPFYAPLEKFTEHFHKNASLTFTSNYGELDSEFFALFEKGLTRIADNFAPSLCWENAVDAFSIHIKGITLRLKLEDENL